MSDWKPFEFSTRFGKLFISHNSQWGWSSKCLVNVSIYNVAHYCLLYPKWACGLLLVCSLFPWPILGPACTVLSPGGWLHGLHQPVCTASWLLGKFGQGRHCKGRQEEWENRTFLFCSSLLQAMSSSSSCIPPWLQLELDWSAHAMPMSLQA